MTPIDLPPDNFLAALRGDRCRPSVRESYLSRADDGGHDHEDMLPAEPLPFPAALAVPSVQQTDHGGVWRHRHAREQKRRFYATVWPDSTADRLRATSTAAPE